ncbi:MAG: hypothetical protein QOJ40_1363 [Verrucomicrobiota bacterium]
MFRAPKQITRPVFFHAAPAELGRVLGRPGCYRHGAPPELFQNRSAVEQRSRFECGNSAEKMDPSPRPSPLQQERGGARSSHKVPGCVSIFLGGLLLSNANAQFALPQASSASSRSGQFVVHAAPGQSISSSSLANDRDFVRLDVALLTVSCERIKQILWRELGATTPWRGKIHLVLFEAGGADEAVTITSEQFKDGWQYRLDLPDVVERTRYVRSMVQVLLLELANRAGGAHPSEIPIWLIEGLAQQLLASNEIELVLAPPRGTVNGLSMSSTIVNARKNNPLDQARAGLRAGTSMTFEELSWPAEGTLDGDAGERYRLSAQLFVSELLGLKDGAGCLRTMLAELPQYYNWQLAFLHAFQGYFQRPVDVEKWWSLRLVRFTGREVTQTWPLEESWRKLDQSIRLPVQVRTINNELPLHSEITLQTIIREWDRAHQTETLRSRLVELEMLRLQTAPQLVPLVDEYCKVLQSYLKNRDQNSILMTFRHKARLRHVAEQAVKELNALDARREAMRPKQKPIAAASVAP